MRIKLIAFFLIGLLFFSVKQVSCDDIHIADKKRVLFLEGNAHYSQGRFEDAISSYEGLLETGFESGNLYYNLGNAYFNQGFSGKAILNYLRAKRFIPKDADLKSNLDYARSRIKGGVIAPKRRWFVRLFYGLVDSATLDKAVSRTVILYFILSALIILSITTKRSKAAITYAGGVIALLLVVSLIVTVVKFKKVIFQKQAVVIADFSESKFEPFDDATTHFILNEGEDVIVISKDKGEWVKIRRVDGKQGWVKGSDCESL